MNAPKQEQNAPKPQQLQAATRRRRWLTGALGAALILGTSYGFYWTQVARYHQTTDDAYVGGNVVEITPQISGTVSRSVRMTPSS